jgi:hypothetical protein
MKMRIDIMPLVEKDRLFLRKGDETPEQTIKKYLAHVWTKLDNYLKGFGARRFSREWGLEGSTYLGTRTYVCTANPGLHVRMQSSYETSPLRAIIEVTSDENTLRTLNQMFIEEHHLQKEEGFIFEEKSGEIK